MQLSTNGSLGTFETLISAPHTGHSAEDLAKLCTDKIVYVGDSAPPAIRDQALAFRDRVQVTVLHYLRQARTSERTRLIGVLEQSGQHEAAELLRKL